MSIEKATLFGKSFVARFNIFVAASWCFTKIKRPSKKLFVLNLSHCSYKWRGGFFWNYFLPEIKRAKKCTFSSIWQVKYIMGRCGVEVYTHIHSIIDNVIGIVTKSRKSRGKGILNSTPDPMMFSGIMSLVLSPFYWEIRWSIWMSN